MIVEGHYTVQFPDDHFVRVSEDGHVFRRVNISHPERRQWLRFKTQLDKNGYSYLRFANKKWLIHRLVYSLFVGELVPGMVICHRDGSRTNNHWKNLLQATQKENISHKLQHGTHQEAESHPKATHTADQIRAAKSLLAAAPRSATGRLKRGEATYIAHKTGCSIHTVHDLHSKKSWSSL
jgi:hypothetical protein